MTERREVSLSFSLILCYPPSHSFSPFLPLYLSIYLFIYLSICLSVYPCIYLFMYLSRHLSVHLSITLSIYLSFSPSLFIYLSINLYLAVHPASLTNIVSATLNIPSHHLLSSSFLLPSFLSERSPHCCLGAQRISGHRWK